jgi:succinyl-diaminopimelate desuccinylase
MPNDHPALELTKALISAESVTPNDGGCQKLMAERLAPLGFHNETMPFEDQHGAVTNLWSRRGTSAPCIVFAGHTDVVPTGDPYKWRHHPFSPTIKDGLLYGRGAADMKCSLAAFIVATEEFVREHPDHQGSIAYLITSDEEGPATCGTRKVIETLEARGEKFAYCLVGEPSSSDTLGDTIKNGRRGSIGCHLTVVGKQGHIAYPHLAKNPIHDCGAVISALTAIEWDSGNDYFPPTSLQISNINGGTGATNVIPGEVEIVFNLRFSTEITHQEIQQRVSQRLDELDVSYQLDWTLFGQPFLTPEAELVNACRQAIKNALGIDSQLSTSGGTSDGRFIAPTGAQVVELGPINATIHQRDENVPLDSPEQLTKIYKGVLSELLLRN